MRVTSAYRPSYGTHYVLLYVLFPLPSFRDLRFSSEAYHCTHCHRSCRLLLRVIDQPKTHTGHWLLAVSLTSNSHLHTIALQRLKHVKLVDMAWCYNEGDEERVGLVSCDPRSKTLYINEEKEG